MNQISRRNRSAAATVASHRPTKAGMRGAALVLTLLLSLSMAIAIFAAPAGDLDPSFDSDGKARAGFGTGVTNDQAYGAALQPDGKFVLGGTVRGAANDDLGAARFLPDGSLDTSFGASGWAVANVLVGDIGEAGAVLQRDGKIVVAGYSGSVIVLARFCADGSLDNHACDAGDSLDFGAGGGGTVSINIAGFSERGLAIEIEHGANRSLDKIYVAGYAQSGANYDFLLVRYTATGSLDTSFNGVGYVTLDVRPGDTLLALALQPDGKIIVGGFSDGTSGGFPGANATNLLVARFTSAGSLDTTFSGNGYDERDLGGSNEIIRGLSVQPDGKILATGYTNFNSDGGTEFGVIVLRYCPNGDLDAVDCTGTGGDPIDFDGDGIAITDLPNNFSQLGWSVRMQPDGKIVVGGTGGLGAGPDLLVLRYLADGGLDTTFSSNGYVHTEYDGLNDEAHALMIQPSDSKIVVAGQSGAVIALPSWTFEFGLARYFGHTEVTQSVAIGAPVVFPDTDLVITLNAADAAPCDFTVRKYPAAPGGGFPSFDEMPIYWDIQTTCTGYNVDLVFSYSDIELYYGNNVVEANLKAYRSPAGSPPWTEIGGAVNTGTNTVTVTGATTLNYWGLASAAPTAVTMSGLTARTNIFQVDLSWQTVLEIDMIGFNVYRSSTSDGERTLIATVEPQGEGTVGGAVYHVTDRYPKPGQVFFYWVEAVSAQGSQWTEPVSLMTNIPFYVPLMLR